MADLNLINYHYARIEPSFSESHWSIYNEDDYNIASVPVKLFHLMQNPADFLNLLIEQKVISFKEGAKYGTENAQRLMRRAMGVPE